MTKINTIETRKEIMNFLKDELQKGIVCATKSVGKIMDGDKPHVSLVYYPNTQKFCVNYNYLGRHYTLWDNLEDACEDFDSAY